MHASDGLKLSSLHFEVLSRSLLAQTPANSALHVDSSTDISVAARLTEMILPEHGQAFAAYLLRCNARHLVDLGIDRVSNKSSSTVHLIIVSVT